MTPSSSSSPGIMTRSRTAASTVKKPKPAATAMTRSTPPTSTTKKDNNTKTREAPQPTRQRPVGRKESTRRVAGGANAPTDYMGYALLAVLLVVTVVTYPRGDRSKATWQHVWYYGWITAVSTGLGAVPFYFFQEPNKYWMGVSNGTCT